MRQLQFPVEVLNQTSRGMTSASHAGALELQSNAKSIPFVPCYGASGTTIELATAGQPGFEQPQGWSRRAVQRTAPMAMLLYTLVVLWFSREGHRHYQPLAWPWYPGKTQASFADMLATLRCQSVRQEVLSMHLHGSGSRNILKRLIHVVKQAA
jgi:hypothetical protein